MTLCEKCIHEEVCDQSSRRMWSAMAGETECSDFKNKADFVEVVRCGRCEHFIPDSELDHEEYLNPLECDGWCENTQCYAYKDDFCSYGERRRNERAEDNAEEV